VHKLEIIADAKVLEVAWVVVAFVDAAITVVSAVGDLAVLVYWLAFDAVGGVVVVIVGILRLF